ncbi:uncharacterized protein LOC108031604 [Drosophila biarmipes]|uniref:uncharacterized protein LOC108031604 n=1 Tax=Drosophila biarmipes TaxID=125945 RepID=UPI0007E6D62E|nr:uncharacterized protein LOC108031604 [Drosophila biarmipes]
MDRSHKSDEAFGHNSRRVMWKLSEEEETFDSLVNYRRLPVRSQSDHQNRSQVSGAPTKKRTATENWLLLVRDLEKKEASSMEEAKKSSSQRETSWSAHPQTSATSLPEVKETSAKERAIIYWRRLFDGIHKRQRGEKKSAGVEQEDPAEIVLTAKPSLALRYKPSHESLKHKRSKDLAPERCPSSTRASTSCKLVSDIQLESFSLPPQQTCVVREVAPRFAHRRRLSIANDTDSCCSGELEVPKNSPVQDQEPGPRPRSELISVHVSAPTSSSFMEAARRSTSPVRRRTAVSKVAAGTKGGSSPAAGGNKCSSASSGSAGTTTTLPTFRQRQQELHRYRVMIERRRLDLLELKIAREREEALHNEILFHKDLQIKDNMIKAYEDNDCSNA